ncbi:MAG: FAD-dependent oxidoreductase, partial [bacterium]
GADLISAEIEGRRQAYQVVDFLRRRVPGFTEVVLLETPPQIGVRETRRVMGAYVLQQEDILGGVKFPDAIACGGYPIDLHDPVSMRLVAKRLPAGEYYSIPYRCLLPRGLHNLMSTGRCVSATHEAFAAFRVSAIAMAIGQGTGTAAAMAVAKHITPGELDVQDVRRRLRERGAFLPP